MSSKTRSLNVRYFILQVLFWGAAVVIYAYMTQILEYKGYSEVEIGVLGSVKLFAGVFFQLWIGPFADKYVYELPLKYIIAALSAISAGLTFVLYILPHNFVLMIFVFAGFGISFLTVSPLIDSMSLLYSNHGQKVNFAKGRMGGSISWALLCVLAGVYCDKAGVESFPLFGCVLTLAMALFAMSMDWDEIRIENAENEAETKSVKVHSSAYLIKNYPMFFVFLIGSAVMFMGYCYGSVFLIDIFTGLGGNNTQYGISEFVLAISEVPSAFIVMKCKKKISMKWVMLCCAIFMTLKNLIPTYSDSILIIILAQLCEMLGFGLFYAGGMYLVAELIPKEDMIKATTMISVATVGLGEGLASVSCGAIRKSLGLYGLMKFGTLTNVVAILIMLGMCFMKKKDKSN